MKIKILYIYPNLNIGGAQKVVLDLVNNIDYKRFDVYLACNGGKFLYLVNKNVKILNLDFIDNKRHIFKSIFYLRYFIKKERIDIIHSHHRYTSALSNFATVFTKTRVIHSEHNIFPNKNYFNLRGNNIIAVSKSVKNNLIKYGVKSKNINVIYNGIEENKYINAYKKDLKNELGIDGFTFGFIGRLSEQKGLAYMLEAFNNIYNQGYKCNLVIIGDGILRKDIEKFILENNLGDYIYLLGFRSDIENIINSIDIYILPSIFEGFPMTNMEIMISSKCLIATDVGGNKEIIDNNIDGFIINSKDVLELENKMKYVLDNKEILEKMNLNAKEKVIKNFTIDKMKNNHMIYYENLLKNNF
ncbi:TPA: glycosyltransferase family 4 protein [Clostridium perfringens]|uniref:glycosyltransferase family 4 protein n=1 Tax=Clostridium perfringens TaxID=1502 RepID=UPI002AC496F6|nr:glycosyltransferase family 4 protein [Clostridium perfringens]MDZ4939344.1 glycosyltransferase [Clostridium perfringens]